VWLGCSRTEEKVRKWMPSEKKKYDKKKGNVGGISTKGDLEVTGTILL